MRQHKIYITLALAVFSFFTAHNNVSANYQYVSQFGTFGSGDGQVNQPLAAVPDSAGNIYVADTNNHRVQKFNSSFVFQLKFGSGGAGNGQFQYPQGIAIDTSGNIFVVDTNNHRIQKFDATGIYQSQFGNTVDLLMFPVKIVRSSSGDLYVADVGHNRIVIYDSSGVQKSIVGSGAGPGPGQLDHPYGVTVDSAGNIYVADTTNSRIEKFDSSGAFLLQFGTNGSGDGQFGGIYGVAVDSLGNIYGADTANNRIEKFNPAGVYQSQFGTFGAGNGQFNGPYALSIDSANNLFVVDYFNNRIQKFSDNVLPNGSPILTTLQASSPTLTSATISGSIENIGLANIDEHGFAYGTSPTLDTTIATSTLGTQIGTGVFFSSISGLSPNTTYFFRAYAHNTIGTGYGAVVSFTTSAVTVPVLTTSAASDVSTSTVTLSARITATGGADASDSGFAYGTSPTLDTTLATTSAGAQVGAVVFTKDITGLTPNTVYFFRPYADNSAGRGFGTIQTFTTVSVTAPTLTTQAITSIGATSATANGNITVTGNSNPTQRGAVYGTAIPYTATTTIESGDFSTGAFTASITGLTCNTLYHVAPFATNSLGSGYGPDVTFTTTPCIPSVTTNAASLVATSTLILSGTITVTGGANIIDSGFAYGTSPSLATTIATSSTGAQSGTATFSQNLTGLTPNTVYFFRAYADNITGRGFGAIASVTTIAASSPRVSVSAASGISETAATLNATIDSIGDSSVTERGFEWGIDTTYGTIISTSGSFATGPFDGPLVGLTCNTAYHFRAFATNSTGTASSTDATFTTSACPVAPIVQNQNGGGSISSGGSTVSPGALAAILAPSAAATAYINSLIGNIFVPPAQPSEPINTVPPTNTPSFPGATFPNRPVPVIPSIEQPPFTPVESPLVLKSGWDLIPPSAINNFVFEKFPSDIADLISKFPQLGKVFTELGISKVADLGKLQDAKINLPAITEKSLTPTEIVTAASGNGSVGIGSILDVTDAGSLVQEVHVLGNTPITLSVKPQGRVESIKGYLTFKQTGPQAILGVPIDSLAASAILAAKPVAEKVASPGVPAAELLVKSFEYTDPDGDGIYTAVIQTPQVEGTYEVITLINYSDKVKGSKELRLLTVIDPEGYVYRSGSSGEETRIRDVTVSLWSVSNGASALWEAAKYAQSNPELTDSTGKYSFLVPEGTYYLTAEAKGYASYRGEDFTVKEGSGVHFNIRMQENASWLSPLLDWKMLIIIVFGIALVLNFINDRRVRKKLLSGN